MKLACVLVLLLVSAARAEEPGFTLEQGEKFGRIWWTITNQEESAITINSVTINGEYACPAGFWFREVAVMSNKASFPMRLTIGDRAAAMQYDGAFPGKSYQKKPIFIDVRTDRGVFRFKFK